MNEQVLDIDNNNNMDGVNDESNHNSLSDSDFGTNDLSDDSALIVLDSEYYQLMIENQHVLINRIEFIILINLVIFTLLLFKIFKRRRTA